MNNYNSPPSSPEGGIVAQGHGPGRRQLGLPLYRHDLESWFSRFAANLKEVPNGNPMTDLMDADAEINPYFLTFGLYWFRVPGRTVADRGHRLARTALARISKLPSRLREDAGEIRWVLNTKFPPPLGRQLQELSSKVSSIGSLEEMEGIAGACERGAPMFENLFDVLRDQASGKRNPRSAYATILYLHVAPKITKRKIGKMLSVLVDCADATFGLPQRFLEPRTFELGRKRYQERHPEDYRRRRGEAERSRGPLSPEEAVMWHRLNDDDCLSIIESLRPRFNLEVACATRP
jgi:hypothetical protein